MRKKPTESQIVPQDAEPDEAAERALRWERRPEERPQELLDAAIRVLAQRGYRATRLEEVAEAAGVSKGTIYHYFDSKEALISQALLQKINAKNELVLKELRGMSAPASVRLRHVLRTAWRLGLEPEICQGFRVLTEVAQDAPELFRLYATEGVFRSWGLIQELIDEGVAAGEFRRDVDVEVAARVISAALRYQAVLHAQLRSHGLDPVDTDRLFESAVDLFLRGLRGPAAAVGA